MKFNKFNQRIVLVDPLQKCCLRLLIPTVCLLMYLVVVTTELQIKIKNVSTLNDFTKLYSSPPFEMPP
jgi:hypothetical protein